MGLLDKLSTIAASAGDGLARVAGKVEHDVATGTGIIGTPINFTNRVIRAHQKLKDTGAYGALVHRVTSGVTGLYGGAVSRLDKLGTNVEAFVANTEARKEFGDRFVKFVQSNAALGRDALITAYRSRIPTQEELETKYSGIGSDYEGVLLRDDLDATLTFATFAAGKLPRTGKHTLAIQNDIRASASSNKGEILTYLASKEATVVSTAAKSEYKGRQATVTQYL